MTAICFSANSPRSSAARTKPRIDLSPAAAHGGGGFRWTTNTEERTALWDARHKAYYADLALKPGGTALSTDVCVPISALCDCITETRAAVDAFHAAALARGGSDEGAPGLRPQYGPSFYAGYVRDPDGNKLNAVCYAAEAPPAPPPR